MIRAEATGVPSDGMLRRRRRWVVPLLLALLPVALVLGAWMGSDASRLPASVRDALGADPQTDVYDEVMDRLSNAYYRELDRDDLLDRSLEGAVDSLDDRFSAYFDPDAYAHFQELTEGEFQGVGLSVEAVERGLRIVSVFDGSPAARAGLRPGDVVVEADGTSLRGKTAQEATALIKGPAGTRVEVTVQRDGGAERTVSLRRERVAVPVVESEMRRSRGIDVGHVSLSSFSSGAHGEVAAAFRRLRDDGADALVLDLRNNGGGLLNEAVLVSSLFIPDGPIVTTKGRARPSRTFEATGSAIDTRLPMVVLVNGQSASASEIVTAALRERNRAKVVGTQTFGKGVFQEVIQLSNGGALDITVGEYFTPKGRNLGGGGTKKGSGIAPDVHAEDDAQTRRDEALEVAVRTVARNVT